MTTFAIAVTGGTYNLSSSATYTPPGTPGAGDTVNIMGALGGTFTGTCNAGTVNLGGIGATETDIINGDFTGTVNSVAGSGAEAVTIGTLGTMGDGTSPVFDSCIITNAVLPDGLIGYTNVQNSTFTNLSVFNVADFKTVLGADNQNNQMNNTGSVSFDGGSNTYFVSTSSTDPGISNVKSGTTYSINGTAFTGTYPGGGGTPANGFGMRGRLTGLLK